MILDDGLNHQKDGQKNKTIIKMCVCIIVLLLAVIVLMIALMSKGDSKGLGGVDNNATNESLDKGEISVSPAYHADDSKRELRLRISVNNKSDKDLIGKKLYLTVRVNLSDDTTKDVTFVYDIPDIPAGTAKKDLVKKVGYSRMGIDDGQSIKDLEFLYHVARRWGS